MPGAILQLAQLTVVNLPQRHGPQTITPAPGSTRAQDSSNFFMHIANPVLADMFQGWALPLWHFSLNRSDPDTHLFVKNVTLVVPQNELEVVKETARLACSNLRTHSVVSAAPFAAASFAAGTGLPDPELANIKHAATLDSAARPVLHPRTAAVAAALLAYAADSVLESSASDTLQYSRMRFCGWVGQDVIITSRMPAHVPAGRVLPWNESLTPDFGKFLSLWLH